MKQFKKPVLSQVPLSTLPITNKAAKVRQPVILNLKEIRWSFSFKYFRQIDYFGLGDTEPSWFISLLERLKDLSEQTIDLLITDYTRRDAYRFHKIDWDATNIPLIRSDFNWLDKNVVENEEDYPFYQFQISKALGRVVGYFDETYQHFYIVLLDHKHNLQPSKHNDYKVDDTTELFCELTSLMMDIDRIRGIKCSSEGCKCKNELVLLPTKLGRGKFIYCKMDDDYHQELVRITSNKSIKEIIEMGILCCSEEETKN